MVGHGDALLVRGLVLQHGDVDVQRDVVRAVHADAAEAGLPQDRRRDAVHDLRPACLRQLVHALAEGLLRGDVLPDEMPEHGVAAEFLDVREVAASSRHQTDGAADDPLVGEARVAVDRKKPVPQGHFGKGVQAAGDKGKSAVRRDVFGRCAKFDH